MVPTILGFPPVDADLRDYFVYGSGDRATARNKLHGFLYSLLMITRKRLETIAEKQGDHLPTLARITCQ